MSAFFEEFKDEYVDLLFKVSSQGNWNDWIEFCLRGTIQQSQDAIRRSDLIDALREDLANRLNKLGKKSFRMGEIVQDLIARPLMTIPILAKRFGVQYQTAKSDIERLIEAGILDELKGNRPKVYFSKDIYRIAFAQADEIEAMDAERRRKKAEADGSA